MEPEVHADLCKYAESLYASHPPEWEKPEETSGKELEDQFKTGNSNLLLLMPRGTFKTSVITVGFSLQMILNDPNVRILLDSETFSKSKAFLAEIKGHLEMNEEYREVFRAIHGMYPDGIKKKSDLLWTDSQINLACRTKRTKEPNFSCAGVDVTKAGMHFDLIIADDLHSETNVTNKEQINKVIDHWKLNYSLLDPGKPMIVIGTRWDYNDLYQHILDNERESYNILIRKAIKDDGTLLFPSRLTQAFLDDVKRKQGASHFSKQYQNEPVDDETATFKRSTIIYKDWEQVKDRPINWYLSIDPSYEGEYSDYAALVVGGMDYQRDLYVRHVTRAKLTYKGIIDEIFFLFTKYQPRTVILETLGTQKSIMYEMNNEMKRRNAWLPLTEIKQRTKSKEERIRALAPFYEFGHIYHIKKAPSIDELDYELIHFPRGKHDDVVDALANILEFASPPTLRSSQRYDQYDDDVPRVKYKPRSPITGV
jgi:predicted phage terminase large subunit-like protein